MKILKKSRLEDIIALENYRHNILLKRETLHKEWQALFAYMEALPNTKYLKGVYNGKMYLFNLCNDGLTYDILPYPPTPFEYSTKKEIIALNADTLPLYINIDFKDPDVKNAFNNRIKDPYGTEIHTNNEWVKKYFHICNRDPRLHQITDVILEILRVYIEETYKHILIDTKFGVQIFSITLNNRNYVIQYLGKTCKGWIALPEFNVSHVQPPKDISYLFHKHPWSLIGPYKNFVTIPCSM